MTFPESGASGPDTTESGNNPPVAARSVARPNLGSAEARLADLVGELARLADEAAFLEREVPPLQARLDAAEGCLWERVAATRRALVERLRHALDSAPRKWVLRRDAQDLLSHLVSDLEERFGVRVRLDLDAWDSDGEIDEDPWESAGFERDRFQKAFPSPESRAPRRRQDPEMAARGVYRALALQLHPDKTRDPDERERRTALMQDLVEAWKSRDLGALLSLLAAHGDERTRSAALADFPVQATLARLEEEREAWLARIRSLRHDGLPPGAVDWMPLVRDPALFERLLRKRRAVPRRELDEMERLLRLWTSPGGLDRFLREVPAEDWPERV